MHHRLDRVNELIRSLISELIERELSLKSGVFVTITRVDTSTDLRYTRLFVSIFPEEERLYAMKTLDHEKNALQKKLHRKLSMRPLPKVDFVLDTTEEHADKIEGLLREIAKEKEK